MMRTDTTARIISRVIGREVTLTAEQEQVAGGILRQAVVILRKSRLAAEQRAGEALQQALLNKPLAYHDRNFTRAIRRLRYPHASWAQDLRLLRSNAAAEHFRSNRSLTGPSKNWLTTRRAAEITGYSATHICHIVRENPGITRRHWSGRLLVNRKDIQAYRRRMKKRGYGPHS